MVTIGPWWVYDTIICFFAFLILLAGIRKGLFVGLYFLLFSAFIYLMLTFIPQLIANAIAPLLIGWLKHFSVITDLSSKVNHVFDSLNNVLKSVMDNFGMGFGALSISGLVTDTATAIIALFLYLIVFVSLAAFLSLLMLIIYACIKQKLQAAKINRYVSSLFGGVFGAFIAIFYASTTSIFFSFPVFDYSSQRFGITKFAEGESITDMMNKALKGGNQYTKYSLSGKTAGIIPAGKITFSYSASCSYKYILTPLLAGITSLKDISADGAVQAVEKVFGSYTDTMIEGYATDNIFELPVKQCIQVMPNESQNLVRLLSEFILTSKSLKSLTSTASLGQRQGGQAWKLYDQMNSYINANYGAYSNYRFDEDGFVNFWNSLPKEENQFLASVDYLSTTGDNIDSIKKVFTDPVKTYRFLRNVYQVNIRLATPSSAPFMPSLFTSLYLMQGLEVSPNGVLSAKLGETYNDAGERLDTSFELRNYMSYVDEE